MLSNQQPSYLEFLNEIIKEHPDLAPNIAHLANRALGINYVPSLSQEFDQVCRLFRSSPKLTIDIGGNHGNYTAEIRSRFNKTEIHVFEPSFHNVKILSERFRADPLITIASFAVSDNAGYGVLYTDHEGSGFASLTQRDISHHNIFLNHNESVTKVTFHEYWVNSLELRHIDFVKIDVEGHEMNVLRSFKDAIDYTNVIQFEFGGTQVDARNFFKDFWDFFSTHNFSIFRICPEPRGLLPITRYSETLEVFDFQNFIAVNRRYHK